MGSCIKIIPQTVWTFVTNMCCNRPIAREFVNCIASILVVFIFMTTSLLAEDVKNQKTIAIIGDSLTQGYGLRTENNFVSKLQEQLLNDNYKIKLLNFGVSGDTTAGGLARFDWSTTPDVSGVVIILGGNDMLRGISPQHSYNNLRSMLISAQKKNLTVLLVGLSASNNFGYEYKRDFDEMYVKLKDEFKVFYYPNFFKALISDGQENLVKYMQADSIHPNEQGVDLGGGGIIIKKIEFLQDIM